MSTNLTPEQRAHETAGDWIMGPVDMGELERLVAAAIRTAINDKLDEVAKEIERLESGTYTTAQTPAGLVRAMKEG